MITVGGNARHNACTIARLAKPAAANYVCATGYTFAATHLNAGGKLDYIDPYGNAASLAVADGGPHPLYWHQHQRHDH